MTTEEIIDLIKKNKFGEAEAALYELRKADRHSTMVSYLFGCLTAAYGNPKRSTTQAREFFTHAVNDDSSQRYKAKMIKDLEYANRHLPRNASVCRVLHDDRVQNGRYFEAYLLAVAYFLSAKDRSADDYGLDLSYLGKISDEIFQQVIANLKERYQVGEGGDLTIENGIFDVVVERLHKENKYVAVTELAQIVSDYHLQKSGVIFHIAYAFADCNKRASAKKYYVTYLQKHEDATNALNNLALLEQYDGRLQKAESLLKKCVDLDPENDLYKRNLKHVHKLKEVAEKFRKEDLATRKLIMELWRRKGPSQDFECAIKDVEEALECSADDAKQRLRLVVEKGYLEENRAKKTFALSPGLRSQISDLERDIAKDDEIAKVARDISRENLETIGFGEELLNTLKKVSSPPLQSLLQRDLKEAALARLTNSHKTTLIMCGSIIEAILADKIYGKSIRKYTLQHGKGVSVQRMDLGDLLYVAMKENLIDDQLYYLAHALRGFRNLIHPGVEQRKKAIAVSESNARIAWDITKKLLLEM
jgi:tetratricopeptide (TPR) repeat protein